MPLPDTIEARISAACPDDTRIVLQTAWARDLSGIKPLLDKPGRASSRDPNTGETAIHAAIRSCGPAASSNNLNNNNDDEGEEELTLDAAIEAEAAEVVYELFVWGGIWNDVDADNATAACLADRLGRTRLYDLCVEAGVRAELLFGLMGGYEELESDEDEQSKDTEEDENEEAPELVDSAAIPAPVDDTTMTDPPVTSKRYLESTLVLDNDKLVDADLNGVMMAWEKPIMERTVSLLIPPPASPASPGPRILNVGFGMGIIDTLFAGTCPSRHHIIEAHPAVLARLSAPSNPSFGPMWESSGPDADAFKVHSGRWQDIVPSLLESGELYDAVYFDTFGEDYAQLRAFFTECLPGLLAPHGRFGYFNGCGADRRVCYDVYARVAEAHLAEAGLDVDWTDVHVGQLGEEHEGEWEGVRRRYWTLESELSSALLGGVCVCVCSC